MTANTLYFVQHGLTTSKTENPDRPLTDEGIKQTTAIASQLLSSNIAVSGIFHSGKLRAQQTAETIASILETNTVAAIDCLSPNADTALIKPHLNQEQAMYIGHLPHLSKLAANLVTGNENQEVIKFHNSAVVCLEKTSSLYSINWYLTPLLLND